MVEIYIFLYTPEFGVKQFLLSNGDSDKVFKWQFPYDAFLLSFVKVEDGGAQDFYPPYFNFTPSEVLNQAYPSWKLYETYGRELYRPQNFKVEFELQ